MAEKIVELFKLAFVDKLVTCVQFGAIDNADLSSVLLKI